VSFVLFVGGARLGSDIANCKQLSPVCTAISRLDLESFSLDRPHIVLEHVVRILLVCFNYLVGCASLVHRRVVVLRRARNALIWNAE